MLPERRREMEGHEILVYQHKKCHCWVVDCELHDVSEHSEFFSDAIGRAMLHRQAAIR